MHITRKSYFGTCDFPKILRMVVSTVHFFFNRHSFVGCCRSGTLEFFQVVILSL